MQRKAIDLIGQRFGRLTVVREAERKNRHTAWECVCDCGNTVAIRADALVSGRTKSCGCLYRDTRKTSKPALSDNLLGQKFGKLTVIGRSENDKYSRTQWVCNCDCGETLIVRGNALKTGHTKSCGCLVKEKSRVLATEMAAQNGVGASNPNTTHGKSNHRLYGIWEGMKSRCYNPHVKSYYRYGGRGITICDEWRNDFTAFYDWAITHGYQDNLSIDRINNEGPYCPENCRWATRKEQANNRG